MWRTASNNIDFRLPESLYHCIFEALEEFCDTCEQFARVITSFILPCRFIKVIAKCLNMGIMYIIHDEWSRMVLNTPKTFLNTQ